MKAFLLAAAGAILGATLSMAVVGQAQSAKVPSAVAFVSSSRILNETTHGRSEAGRAQSAQQQRGAELRAKQQALEATRQQLLAASDAASRLELQKKEAEQRSDFERASQ